MPMSKRRRVARWLWLLVFLALLGAAWKLAEKEWRGVVTLENLQRLEAFHRIAH